MPLDKEITSPVLGMSQDASMMRWRDSLRSPDTSSAFRKVRSRSRTGTDFAGGYLTDVSRTRSPSPSLRRSGSASNLRKSTGTPVKYLGTAEEIKSIENDYIKNLQQQVYFLELEANYLREQARKATEMHPRMTAEAERMLTKLRSLQAECDEKNAELRRREANLDIVHSEKERVLTRLEEEELKREREKRMLTEEIIQLKKERDQIAFENSMKASQVEHVSSDKSKLAAMLRDAENQIIVLRNQLEKRIEEHTLTQLALEEKRSQLIQAETHAREVEDRYYTNTAVLHDKTVNDLRDEIRILRQRLKEADLRSDEDRNMRNKIQDESSLLLKENSLANQKVTELERQLHRERELRDSTDVRQSQSLTELSRLKDLEKELQFDLRQTQEALREEKARCDRYLAQLSKTKDVTSSLEINNSTARNRLAEAESLALSLDNECSQLRRDKQLLVDHVSDLQKQLTKKEDQLTSSRRQIRELEKNLASLQSERMVDDTIQSQKWQEFESLADNMKSLTRTMARSTSPTLRSPRSPRSPLSRSMLA